MTQAAPAYEVPLTAQNSDTMAWYFSAMQRLVNVVQDLSHARDMDTVAAIVREAARNLTGADGATFVLRDLDQCYYADENAISPLWKGRRFPMSTCISGWVMMNAQPATIEDIYSDARIPADAYRPTFVKSLAMVPIRRSSPIGAIGNYWATQRHPLPEEVAILQALADTTSVAIENVQLYGQLQAKLQALQESNYELSRFAWVASHDLQEPLRTIVTQVELLAKRCQNKLDDQGQKYIGMASEGARRLQNLIEDLLVHARAEKSENFRPVSLTHIIDEVLKDLHTSMVESNCQLTTGDMPWVWGDHLLLSRLMQNMVSNAIKFRGREALHIHIDAAQKDQEWIISVKDNGIGIDPLFHERIFGLFQRLHPQDNYPGSGIGLATCKKIIELHGGRIWLESQPGHGTTFFFTLPVRQDLLR